MKCQYENEYGHCTLNECMYGDILFNDSVFETSKYCLCNVVYNVVKDVAKQ